MHVGDLEIKQLLLLQAVADTGKLSLAAERVGLSQSAASHSIARMRKLSGDPIFLRSGQSMVCTAYGEQICKASREALQLLSDGLRVVRSFDPATSRRVFSLYMSEVGQIVILPVLLAYLREVAPGVRLRVHRIPEKNPSTALELGDVDLAIGRITTMTTGFHQRVLMKEEYACIACKENKLFKNGLPLDTFKSASHAVADSSGMAHWLIDRELASHGIHRKIGLVLPEFLALPFVIPGSELVATVPRRVADQFAQIFPIKTMPLPLEISSYDVLMLWHERAHGDAANQWLRETLAALFSKSE